MGFNELMNTLFGADWLGTLVQILSSVSLIWITKIFSNVKIRLLNSENSNTQMVGKLLDQNIKVNEDILKVREENAELKEEVKATSDSISKLINIVALSFLDSKGVSSETKLAISKVIGEIEATGVNLDQINKTVNSATKAASIAVSTVNKMKDEIDTAVETSIQASEGIKEASLELYNTILSESNEQQA